MWTKLAENRIEEAIASGEFDDLPGRGQPLNLAEYFALPEAERAGRTLLKNANVVPPEVEILKAIGGLETALRDQRDPQKAAKLRDELQEKRVTLALFMERRRRREPDAIE